MYRSYRQSKKQANGENDAVAQYISEILTQTAPPSCASMSRDSSMQSNKTTESSVAPNSDEDSDGTSATSDDEDVGDVTIENPMTPPLNMSRRSSQFSLRSLRGSFGKRPAELDDVSFEVVAYPTGEAYLDALKKHLGEDYDSWLFNPLIGPTQALLKAEIHTPLKQSFSCYEPPQINIWMSLFSTTALENKGRPSLEVILTKLHSDTVMVGTPKQMSKLSNDRLSAGLDELSLRLRNLLPSCMNTPGGTVKPANAYSPINNVPSIMGPSRLATILSQKLQTSHNPLTVHSSSVPQCNKTTKYRFTHLPATQIPPEIKLMEGCQIRLATMDDKLKTLANLFREHQIAWSGTSNEFISFESCLKAVEKSVQDQTCWIYNIYSNTLKGLSLIAGFLTVGSVTDKTIAITAIHTTEHLRGRGVADSMLRDVTRYYLSNGKQEICAMLPDSADVAHRVFARLKFRLADRRESAESNDSNVSAAAPEGDRYKRYVTIRMAGVQPGKPWHAH